MQNKLQISSATNGQCQAPCFKSNPRISGKLRGASNHKSNMKSLIARLESVLCVRDFLFRKIKSDLKGVDSDGPDDII